MSTMKRRRGRPPAIPQSFFETVFRAYSQGSGYRVISNRLAALGVPADKSSVARLIRGQGCYRGRRVPSGGIKERDQHDALSYACPNGW